MSKKSTFAAGLAATLLPLGGFLVADASTAPSAAGATSDSINTVSAMSVDCASQPQTAFAQAQGGASAPLCSRGTWIYDLPAVSNPAPTRRTESHWGTGETVRTFKAGDTVTYEAEYVGNLGPAGQDDNNWHVIWQLHGPVNGGWPGPAMGLNVRHGTLRLGGGDGHAGQDYARNNYEWTQILAPWRDGVPVRVKVQTYLSTDPTRGWVSAWVDGKQVLNKYKPVSYGQRLMPGTLYSGQNWVASRTGLYRGTQQGNPPSYRQVVTAKIISVG